MRILIFSQYFPPELGACANRIDLFARGLVKKGHKVTVVCGMPNYPIGKIFSGYRFKLLKKEWYHGVEVLRIWVLPSKRKSVLGRVFNYFSYFVFAFLASLFLKKRDIIFVTIPPVTVGFAGLLFKFIKGGKIIVDVRDISEEILYSNYAPGKLIPLLLVRAEKFLLRKAEKIITVTKGIEEYLTEFFKNNYKVSIVGNSIELDGFISSVKPMERDKLGWNNKFVVLYAGNIGYLHNLHLMIDIAKLAREKGVNDLLFVIIGDGVEKENIKAYSSGMDNVLFLDPVERSELFRYILSCDLFFASLADSPFLDFALPSKLLEPMALKKPIVAAFPPACAKRLSSFLPVVFLPQKDPLACLNIILELKSSRERLLGLGEMGLSVVKEKFDANKKIEDLHKIMLELLGS